MSLFHRAAVLRSTAWLFAFLAAGFAHAESWQIVMRSQDGNMSWTVDEKLGVLVTIQSQPNMEMVLRTDLKQTIYMNRQRGVHAVQTWEEGSGGQFGGDPSQFMTEAQQQQVQQGLAQAQEKLKGLPPEARKYAEGLLAGKAKGLVPGQSKSVITYQATGQNQRIGKHQTVHIVELSDGKPTGEQFWVAQLPDWERIATVMEEALENFRQPGKKNVAFTQLNGIPIRMVDGRGRTTNLVSLNSTTVKESQMGPDATSKEVPLMNFMQNAGTSRRSRPNR